ncbi:MAG TPA: DNA translocase FtsK 4TM domain-containing protein, partial [Flexilinea sp.]|nr:DNA translocase FtsK 4TM domain-containing protein [Flexilinea sp.]
MAKKKTNTTKKSTYRGNKKPSMQARKRATQVTNQKKKQNRNTQPIPKTQIIFSALQDIFGTVLILGSTFSLGSLAFQDMNSATAWLAGKMHFIFGQTAVFVGIVGIVLGIWLVFLRRLDKPFSFSWKIFTFCLLVYLFVLVSIQHFAVMQIPFTSSDQAGGIFGEKADNLLIGAFGNGGTLIILFFIATIFVLITWREFLKILPESVGQKLDITEKMWKKVKEIFMVTPAENSREKIKEPEIPAQQLTDESTSQEIPSTENET